jgi:ribosomal-protein-alanine N-acetyltransferase
MTMADLDRVMEIELGSFSTPWRLDTFRSLLARRDARLCVAESRSGPSRSPAPGGAGDAAGPATIVGYAVFWRVGHQAELGDLAVDTARRREGIGARLLEHVIARAVALGVRELFLEVRESNAAARALYAAYDFKAVGRRRGYYSRPKEDALVLLRELEAAAEGDATAERRRVEAG